VAKINQDLPQRRPFPFPLRQNRPISDAEIALVIYFFSIARHVIFVQIHDER
jgi:hypothetical protein